MGATVTLEFGDARVEVRAVTADSRTVGAGALFVAVRGRRSDGHAFVATAVRRGAAAVVVEAAIDGLAVPQLIVPDGARALGHAIAALADHPARRLTLIGITGTAIHSLREQKGRVDWLTLAVVTAVMLLTYLLTIAPDLTLEDSGELAVGSMYAGVPHPPGYPLWTLYSWAFTKILPFSSMAWRVAVSSAVAAAFSAGIIGLMVSRGSSLILESIDLFKDLSRKWENPQCFVSGLVSGLLIGFNGFIWSQAVIVEGYTDVMAMHLAGIDTSTAPKGKR